MHPNEVIHLEHDGKILLVDESGNGPMTPAMGRMDNEAGLRLPTADEVEALGIEWEEKRRAALYFSNRRYTVIKGYPKIEWPKHWAWKDEIISDNGVHPVARESVYRSIHRLVSKVMILNDQGKVLMGKVERGHFRGFWTLPGGYMDHDEHPEVGCVRETLEELGLSVELNDSAPVVTQRIFTEEGISFVSFTYQANWNGEISELNLQVEEIAEAQWFDVSTALNNAVSYFDISALRTLM